MGRYLGYGHFVYIFLKGGTSMKINQIRAALDEHLGRMPGLPAGGGYIRVALLPRASSFGAHEGDGAVQGHGIYQVGISAPSSRREAAERLADEVAAHLGRKTIKGPKGGSGQNAALQTLLPLRTQAVAEKGRVCMAVCVPFFVGDSGGHAFRRDTF
jgi:hypothetical protein